jgi:hypothetical protein
VQLNKARSLVTMPPRPSHPKRNFTSYQEGSGMVPGQTMNRPISLQRPIPTPETQELYNKMRQREEWDLLHAQDEQGDFLQPPSPSQATTMSRSPSCASTTHSVTRGVHDIEIDGDHSRPKKLRAGRHGPLSDSAKYRAALMRKLRACGSCRERKVKVRRADPMSPVTFDSADR